MENAAAATNDVAVEKEADATNNTTAAEAVVKEEKTVEE
jgi:hypothetical protein